MLDSKQDAQKVVSHDAAQGCGWPRASKGWDNMAKRGGKVKREFRPLAFFKFFAIFESG
jgi:hypothetical protein